MSGQARYGSANASASDRPLYDLDATYQKTRQSTNPLLYKTNPVQINNCNKCLRLNPTFGAKNNVAEPDNMNDGCNNLVDVESMLSNRDIRLGHYGKVNDINTADFKVDGLRCCNTFLDRHDTRLTHPTENFREMTIDRFEVLNQDHQCNVFWNFETNSRLQAKDEYQMWIPEPIDQTPGLPVPYPGAPKNCKIACDWDKEAL